MKKVYLAGAMGCYSDDTYPKQWRSEVGIYLSDYFGIINPTLYYNYGSNEHKTEKEVMRFDMRKVLESDIVLVNLKDLDKSLGTSDEILLAYLNGIPVVGFTDDSTKIHSWKYEQIDRIEDGNEALKNACSYLIDFYYV